MCRTAGFDKRRVGILRIAGDLQAMGYSEVNLNLGCPSGTVVAKGRGSGFLRNPKELDQFFTQIFEKARCGFPSRAVGVDNSEEWEELLGGF